MAKLYKEQTQMGFSKMLPQIALGQSQSFILNTALFENNVLHLETAMVPLQSSYTSSGKEKNSDEGKNSNSKTPSQNLNDEGGRPQKGIEERSDKTDKNLEGQT